MTVMDSDPPQPTIGRAAPPPEAAQRVTFGRLQTDDAASLVARRLRAAIGLGVLANGDRLPKEADLARQLGVTAFSLREALSVVRAEGLIVTRAGKNGGSFVRSTLEAGRSLASEGLRRLSATELRDLGDWRQMLTAQSAALAATRGSEASAERLLAYAHEVEYADSAQTARRIFGRFHLELAAAAQSMRLSRAELSMHEEFDWLATVLMEDTAHLRHSAWGLTEIAAAVRARDPLAARDAATALIHYLVTQLATSRLTVIADRHGEAGRVSESTPDDFPGALRQLAEHVVDRLAEIGREIGPLLAVAETPAKLRARVAQSVLSRLDGLETTVHGIGVVAQTYVVPEFPYWMDWWQRASDGSFAHDQRHVLNPGREDFYDYSGKEYFTRPHETGLPWAMGPYVDYGGVDDYLITVAVPLFDGPRFLGVAATDLRVAELENYFAPWLAQARGAFMLLNSESRVILSNSVEHNVGDVVRSTENLSVVGVGVFNWSLVTAGHPVRSADDLDGAVRT